MAWRRARDEKARSFGWTDVNFPVAGSGETKGALRCAVKEWARRYHQHLEELPYTSCTC